MDAKIVIFKQKLSILSEYIRIQNSLRNIYYPYDKEYSGA